MCIYIKKSIIKETVKIYIISIYPRICVYAFIQKGHAFSFFSGDLNLKKKKTFRNRDSLSCQNALLSFTYCTVESISTEHSWYSGRVTAPKAVGLIPNSSDFDYIFHPKSPLWDQSIKSIHPITETFRPLKLTTCSRSLWRP